MYGEGYDGGALAMMAQAAADVGAGTQDATQATLEAAGVPHGAQTRAAVVSGKGGGACEESAARYVCQPWQESGREPPLSSRHRARARWSRCATIRMILFVADFMEEQFILRVTYVVARRARHQLAADGAEALQQSVATRLLILLVSARH